MKARAVIAGMTRVNPLGYGGWGGDCPGCDKDLLKAAAWILKRAQFERVAVLHDEHATWAAFSWEIMEAAADLLPGDLLVIYRSGHGGRVKDLNGDELDGYDETLCMYDRQVPDDEMWSLLCGAIPAGVRVVLISDACHSETAFRDGPPTGWEKDASEFKGRLLAISGCADDSVSWGDASGGKLTAALDQFADDNLSYAVWFSQAAHRMGAAQVPKLVELGESFAGLPALS